MGELALLAVGAEAFFCVVFAEGTLGLGEGDARAGEGGSGGEEFVLGLVLIGVGGGV